MTPALADYLRDLTTRCEQATKGPWDWYNDGSVLLAGEPGEESYPHVLGGEGNLYIEQGDADFIKHARTDLPTLVRLVQLMHTVLVEIEESGRLAGPISPAAEALARAEKVVKEGNPPAKPEAPLTMETSEGWKGSDG